jgi:hypothetical protein
MEHSLDTQPENQSGNYRQFIAPEILLLGS